MLIFPLLTLASELASELSTDVASVCRMLQSQGLHAEIVQVEYELQKGGNPMLRILPSEYQLFFPRDRLHGPNHRPADSASGCL